MAILYCALGLQFYILYFVSSKSNCASLIQAHAMTTLWKQEEVNFYVRDT
jgi:hypothetical protein